MNEERTNITQVSQTGLSYKLRATLKLPMQSELTSGALGYGLPSAKMRGNTGGRAALIHNLNSCVSGDGAEGKDPWDRDRRVTNYY